MVSPDSRSPTSLLRAWSRLRCSLRAAAIDIRRPVEVARVVAEAAAAVAVVPVAPASPELW